MHLCVLLVFLLLFVLHSFDLLQMQYWIQISFFDFTCLLRDNQYYSCIVCLFCFFVSFSSDQILFVCFALVNNLRAINLTFLARLFTCFETWSGIAGFMFCFLFVLVSFFSFGKNHCSHGVGYQLVFFSLFMVISNNFLSLFLPSLPVACLEFWGFCSVTSGHTHWAAKVAATGFLSVRLV